MKNKILSIQSKVVYGYVGNNVAELVIQLHGLDVIAFPTVYLSAHTGHQPIHGDRISKALFDDLILGVNDLKLMDSVSNIITGYIGSEDILLSSAKYIAQIKVENPHLPYICDPVMGDVETGLYVPEAVAQSYLHDIIPICDILTPNHFEFEYIIGHKARTEADVLDAVKQNDILREKVVIVTSCHLEDTAPDEIDTLVVINGMCTRIRSKHVAIDTTGTGDMFTAILASKLAVGCDILSAVTHATETIKVALAHTLKMGHIELNAACLLESIR